MIDFAVHCRLHAHCNTCRTRPEWREDVGAPDECPEGYTEDNYPVAPEHARGLGDHVAKAIHTVSRGKVKQCASCRARQSKLNHLFPAAYERRLRICRECDEFNSQRAHCRLSEHGVHMWHEEVATDGTCPLGKWGV